jgi:hypothetical protein
MSYTITATPLLSCSPYPDCADIEVELPFGLPPQTFRNPCCEGLDLTLDQLSGLLQPLYPFLKLLDCALKLVGIVLAVPDAIGPPPSIGKIAEMAEGLVVFTTECLPYILSLVPVFPTAILAFCRMVRGIARLVLAICRCLKRVFYVNISISADILALSASSDPLLVEMGLCLSGQNDLLLNGLLTKLNQLLNVFTLINSLFEILFTFIPVLKEEMESNGLYPIAPNMSAGVMPPNLGDTMDGLIAVFTLIESASNICAGGS